MTLRNSPHATPLYLQAQETECCIAVLGAMLAHFGRWVPLAELRAVSGISRHCLNAADIARTARHYGLAARVLRKDPHQLAEVGLPLVAHLDFIHFVVVEAIDEQEVKVNDPGAGPVVMPRGVFDERFTGIAIALAPTGQFQPNAGPAPLLVRLRGWIGNRERVRLAAAFALGLAQPLALVAAALLLPFVNEPGHALLGAAGVALLAGALRWGESRALALASNAIAAAGETRLADALAQQPQVFFDYRIPAALQRGAQLPEAVAHAACGIVADTARLASLAILGTGLALLHPGLGAASIVVVAGATALLLRDLRLHGRRLRVLLAGAAGPGAGAALSEAALTGARQDEIARSRSGALAGEVSQRQIALPILLRSNLVVRGSALLLAILYVAVAAGLAPAPALALLLVLAPMARALSPMLRIPARLHALRGGLQLLEDLVVPAGAPAASGHAVPANGGVLEARDLVFGYAPNRPAQLCGVSLALGAGEVVGIGGGAGAGKSTLAAVLSGLVRPWSGQVRLGGQDLAHMADAARAGAVAWLPRQPYFVTGSVRANLCLWREGLDDACLRTALADACLDEMLSTRGGLDAHVTAHGANLSGGQRQRLSIARALVTAPKVLILDEVTDGLDPALEAALLARLRKRGCSVILISQRLSTLAACDRVLMLEHGRLAEETAPPASAPSAVGPSWEAAPVAPVAPVDPGALRACLRRLAEAARVPWLEPACAPNDDRVLALARHHGLDLRLVRMSARSWWRLDPGPMLVFHRDGGSPALLLPEPHTPGRYRILDAHGQPMAPVAHPAQLFDEQCYAVRPSPAGSPVRGERKRLWAAAACALASTLFAFLAMRSATAGMGAALAAGAAALAFQWQAGALLARAAGRLLPALSGKLDSIMTRIDPAALRQLGSSRPGLASSALGALAMRACDPVRGPVWSAGVFAAAALALAVLVPPLGWLAPSVLLAALLPLAWRSRCHDLRTARERRRRTALLAGLLQHANTLRAAGRHRAGLGVWLRMADGRRPDGAALLNGWLAGTPLLAHGVLLGWALSAPVKLASGRLAIAMVALELGARASAALARSARLWARQLPGRRALRAVVRAPRHAGTPVLRSAAPMASLDLHGIGFRFPGSGMPALDGVSLSLRPGRVTALAGPSGSGKSTLLRVLLGFEHAAAGAIVLDGRTLDADGLAALRADTGLVLQDDTLEHAGPLAWQVAGGGDWPLSSVREALRMAVLEEDIARMPMGVQTIVDLANLSTSQFQRLNIARCLLRRPRLLVLDEATSALPDAMQARLIANIRSLGIACLLVSHRASALAAADEVIVLAHGKVVARGPAREAAVAAALERVTGQERRYDLDIAPAARVEAPCAPAAPAVRAGLFRERALRAFQGPRAPATPALLMRRLRWSALAPLAAAALGLAYALA